MPSVLLVEDDESLQKTNSFALKMEGFDVVTASSGAEALVRVEERQFDVILLDMLMIGMSGMDFLKTYDVRTKSPNTKVIALTNLDNPDIVDRAKGVQRAGSGKADLINAGRDRRLDIFAAPGTRIPLPFAPSRNHSHPLAASRPLKSALNDRLRIADLTVF